MKVGIIGYGFVGKALNSALSDSVQVIKIDPKLKNTIKDLKEFNPDLVFICVPTPMQDDGSQNIQAVSEVLSELKELNVESFTAIKSTIHPGNIKKIQNLYPNFVYNPEFLREKHAKEDFINSDLIVFGGDQEFADSLANIYSNHTKCINKEYIFTDVTSASLIKYTINSFLATKVIFFNEINSIFKLADSNESWEDFTKILSKDSRIGNSHMLVPGHDGRLGFGGACLPKDINALLKYAESNDLELSLIKNVIKTNNKIRASYNNKTDRENEQNINYNYLEEEK